MIKIIKHMKRYTLSILAIVALLLVQATADLSLPTYMSSIVNVGIQQNGIESVVPEVVTEKSLSGLKRFMDEKDIAAVDGSYELVRSSDADKETLEKYPILKGENLYRLKDTADQDSEELKGAFGDSMVISLAVQNALKEQNLDVQTIDQLPQEQIAAVAGQAEKAIADLQDSTKEQMASVYVKAEYQNIGMDLDKLQMSYIFSTGAKMLGIALIGMASTVVVAIIAARVAAATGRDLRNKSFEKVMNFSSAELDKFSISSLINRSTNDIQQVQIFAVMALRLVFYAPILGIGAFLKVLGTNTSMSWIIAVALATMLAMMAILFGLAVPKFKKIQEMLDRISLVTRESLIGMMVIRSFNNQKFQEDKLEKVNSDLTKNTVFVGNVMGLMMPIMMFIMNAVTVLIVWYGSKEIDLGNLQLGDMMAFIQYTMMIIMAFLMISLISMMFPRVSVSASRIAEVMDTEYSILDKAQVVDFEEDEKGTFEFRNVHFRYPGAEEDVLCDISFGAERGQTVAVIGSTGSGKSTLVNLLDRFYDATGGEVIVEGRNVKDVSQKELRSIVGYIPQKAFLFSGNIESNIKYGDESMSDEQMKKAAEIAQAIEFIEAKPEGYGRDVVEGGANLSGGQKQRMSIARALAKDPRIVIFDDSFSALDYKTDLALRNEIRKELRDTTLLIVAQRISTIKDADLIVVLDEGRIVGKGLHDELLEKCKVYKEIALSQMSKEELSNE